MIASNVGRSELQRPTLQVVCWTDLCTAKCYFERYFLMNKILCSWGSQDHTRTSFFFFVFSLFFFYLFFCLFPFLIFLSFFCWFFDFSLSLFTSKGKILQWLHFGRQKETRLTKALYSLIQASKKRKRLKNKVQITCLQPLFKHSSCSIQ